MFFPPILVYRPCFFLMHLKTTNHHFHIKSCMERYMLTQIRSFDKPSWCNAQKHQVIYPYFVLLGSESSTVEIHISSELQDYEDVDADGESLENSVRH